MTNESDTPDTGDLPPRTMMWVAPRQHGKSAGIKSLLRFHAEVLGNWVAKDGSRLVSDPPDFSEDDQ